MAQVHVLDRQLAGTPGSYRRAVRRRVLITAAVRLRGRCDQWPLTVKDISSTGIKAQAPVDLFAGARVDVNLPNLGWIPATVVRNDDAGALGINFAFVIDPERIQVRVTGRYSQPAMPAAALRSV